MANRKTKSKLNVRSRRNNAHSSNNHVGAKELLDYLVTPLHLPPFDVNNTVYKKFIIDTVERLLIEAIETILPEKVLGVQFIFAKRSRSGKKREIQSPDFSFPFLLCCKTKKEAIALSDGLAYVTRLLMNQNSSFHYRVRKLGLTYSPAVCIYSIYNPPVSKREKDGTTNVLWVKLPIDDSYNEVRFPLDDLDDLNRQLSTRFFYNADLNSSIAKGYFDAEKNLEISLSDSNVRILSESALTKDRRRDKLRILLNELAADVDYLKRVSYLLKFGDVILCTPHAYNEAQSHHSDNPMNPHEVITDAGLTIVVDRKKGSIKEDDWLRIQVVAQKLALFAGAAISTATEARESILNTLNDGFLHEYSNSAKIINSRLFKLQKEDRPFSDSDLNDIRGRLQFTQVFIESAMTVYKSEEAEVEKMLDDLITPLRKYKDVDILTKYNLPYPIKVVTLWQTVLVEVLRNSYKYGEITSSNKKSIFVQIEQKDNYVIIAITNQVANAIDRNYKLNPPKGWSFIEDMTRTLKGEVMPEVNGDKVSIIIKIPMAY
jgi:two-component sensor histidine kinase